MRSLQTDTKSSQTFFRTHRNTNRKGSTVNETMETTAASDTDIRVWAKANGIHVGKRGRISATIRNNYAASKAN